MQRSYDFLTDVLSKRIKSTDNIKAGKYLMKIDNVNKISKDTTVQKFLKISDKSSVSLYLQG